MSAPIENVQVEVKEKKPKKPTLSAKYQKFMIFGYAFVNQLQAANLLAVEENSVDMALTQLKLFDSVEDQTQFYSNFLEESSATGKSMRKFIQNKNKPPKAEKKPRAPRKKAAAAVTETETAAVVEEKEKAPAKTRKPRAKKSITVVNDTENNIIGQLVAAAQNEEPIVVTAPAPVVEKEKKPRKKAEPKVKNVAAPVVESNVTDAPEPVAPVVEPKVETKEKKPRKKAEPKAKAAPAPAPIPPRAPTPVLAEENDDEDEIHTREFVLNDVTYLIDGDNNVYSVDESHDHIGVYNPVTKTIESV